MKTAIVLTGSIDEIQAQAKTISGFLVQNQQSVGEIWVCGVENLKAKEILLPSDIGFPRFFQLSNTGIAEPLLDIVSKKAADCDPNLILFPNGPFFEGIAARISIRLNGSYAFNVTSIHGELDSIEVKKLVYAGHMKGRFKLNKAPFCLTIGGGFAGNLEKTPLKIEDASEIPSPSDYKEWLISSQQTQIENNASLQDTKRVVAIGNGISTKDEVVLLEKLAKLIGGSLGASRPVVMKAWVEMNKLIGVSGTVLSPELCIAVGVSGSAAFSVGIEKSRCLISINQDTKAPIFKISHAGVKADYRQIIEQLVEKLEKRSGQFEP